MFWPLSIAALSILFSVQYYRCALWSFFKPCFIISVFYFPWARFAVQGVNTHGNKTGMVLSLPFSFSWLWGFKGNGPSTSIFNTLHSLSLWYQVFIIIIFLYFLGLGGGLSWGNCPFNSKWHYRKTKVMGCVVLRAECCLAISPLVLQCVLKLCLRSGSARHFA